MDKRALTSTILWLIIGIAVAVICIRGFVIWYSDYSKKLPGIACDCRDGTDCDVDGCGACTDKCCTWDAAQKVCSCTGGCEAPQGGLVRRLTETS